MGFSKQDRVTNPPGGTWRAVKGQAQGSLHLEEKDRTPAALRPLEIPRLASETLWPVPTTRSDPNPLLGTPTLRLNRPRPRFELHPAPLDAPSPTHATTPPQHTFPSLRPSPPTPTSSVRRRCPRPPQPRPPSAPRPLSSPSPGSTQSSGLTARPVPGAATSARPGPRAVEPPQLRGPGRHPFPRPLPPPHPALAPALRPLPAPLRPARPVPLCPGPRVPQPPPPPPPPPPRSGTTRAAPKTRTLDYRALGSGFRAAVESGAGERRGNPEPG
ncbi:vegetative cell wall protein gp1-like [Panthera tigris]|uniref:vegetative cell wall protein gp1-like n=1 Tax=Panthera tigris TaxID=9694 RepID=UPI001C6F78A1|nr:vegetative cell wall protein gp1-like [Panthera tigris]